LEKEKDMECSDWGRADSIGIIIMVIGGLFLFILVLYIVRFGYKGAPTLLENVLVIVYITKFIVQHLVVVLVLLLFVVDAFVLEKCLTLIFILI
jgi:hypothetical protein